MNPFSKGIWNFLEITSARVDFPCCLTAPREGERGGAPSSRRPEPKHEHEHAPRASSRRAQKASTHERYKESPRDALRDAVSSVTDFAPFLAGPSDKVWKGPKRHKRQNILPRGLQAPRALTVRVRERSSFRGCWRALARDARTSSIRSHARGPAEGSPGS